MNAFSSPWVDLVDRAVLAPVLQQQLLWDEEAFDLFHEDAYISVYEGSEKGQAGFSHFKQVLDDDLRDDRCLLN
jgi:hypothetical protein